MLVSELVTNVVLHAGTDIDLRCCTFSDAARFEVRDGSTVLPGIRHYHVASATGRGIGLVDAIATRWGANPEQHGKVVWFQIGETQASPPQPEASVRRNRRADDFVVRFDGLPVALVRATVEHGDALLRDLAMIDMSKNSDPGAWRSPQIDLTPVLEPVHNARGDGLRVVDVDARFPHGAGKAALERLTRINDGEELAKAGGVSVSAGSPELTACRAWLLSEIALQAEGASPTPWKGPTISTPRCDR